ncbi:carbohydrate ABC transporter permease [Spirulina sp. CS-785/01]|uniref:carbohydrate ABC transporter permease n=1 Tax=Spirulina sp. CS-785/01 TaxID=3021716 RepID=UPI00232DC68C|nr:carbohydrate ABC transporter permease [Spirulina sp. CS-785/01]MDB9313274.1 carbohydrate ABC transporter permease [Spirulina sp. CS-785/01]
MQWQKWLNFPKFPFLRVLGLTGGAILVLSPLLLVVITSLSPQTGVILPSSFTLENYQQAWQRGDFLLAFANSTLVALAVTGFQLVTSALAGYALARLRFRGQQAILLLILATLVIPFQILVIPIFILLKWGSLLNTYWALILPTAVSGYGIFLMRQFFVSIPVDIEEAAVIDGASRLDILWSIMLPLARPGLVTLFLFAFIGEWNDLFKPLIFTTRPELQTVQLALAEFQEQFTNRWPLLMAAVIIATIPVVVLFLLGQKQFIRGIGTTGIKN